MLASDIFLSAFRRIDALFLHGVIMDIKKPMFDDENRTLTGTMALIGMMACITCATFIACVTAWGLFFG